MRSAYRFGHGAAVQLVLLDFFVDGSSNDQSNAERVVYLNSDSPYVNVYMAVVFESNFLELSEQQSD
jgi:hypothetical protein